LSATSDTFVKKGEPVLRRQQAEERKAPYIAIIGKEGD